jgi:hypothetical protein
MKTTLFSFAFINTFYFTAILRCYHTKKEALRARNRRASVAAGQEEEEARSIASVRAAWEGGMHRAGT